MKAHHRVVTGLAVALSVMTAAIGCSASDAKSVTLRQASRSYLFSVTPSYAPPHALDSILYTVVVRDAKTREPVQGGEGQIYAGHPQGPKTWDGFTYGPEVGTYHGWLNFAMAGTWNVNIRFRRDSLSPLENTNWMQDVLAETPYQPKAKKP